MALDGITVANLKKELSDELLHMHIAKIAQPEADELLLTFKGNSSQKRLLLSASATLPLLYLTAQNKVSPLTAPNFCMLLRKHLLNGRLLAITQPGLERILCFEIEHLNELHDLCRKRLIIELMGKHSNIIFCDDKGKIIDSIKHISGQISSVREVLPGRDYFIPQTTKKRDPLSTDEMEFVSAIRACPSTLIHALYESYTGISPVIASEICHAAKLDGDAPVSALTEAAVSSLFASFAALLQQVKREDFTPVIYEKNGEPVEFASVRLTQFSDLSERVCSSISTALFDFYDAKAAYTRIRQKSSDLRHIITTALERAVKKYDLQKKQLSDTKKREKYRLYGELLTAYAYQIKAGEKSFLALDYNTGETVTIPLDPTLLPNENAQKYFARYQKLKRTYEALTVQLKETGREIAHLESVLTSLDLVSQEEDLTPIRAELLEYGYIKKRSAQKKAKDKSRPWHYLSSDGFELFVGKNNYQNDELTFKLANSGDWWFHAKKMPGSHVILKTGGKEVPDRAFEEAAALAAYYSRGRGSEKVEIDYLKRKDVKKPNGAVPGYVIYYTNYSMTAKDDISALTLVED